MSCSMVDSIIDDSRFSLNFDVPSDKNSYIPCAAHAMSCM